GPHAQTDVGKFQTRLGNRGEPVRAQIDHLPETRRSNRLRTMLIEQADNRGAQPTIVVRQSGIGGGKRDHGCASPVATAFARRPSHESRAASDARDVAPRLLGSLRTFLGLLAGIPNPLSRSSSQ